MTSGVPPRSARWRWWTCASGTGCTTIRRPTPAELKQATLAIARDVWNEYFAPVFGQRDVILLGIYSHMIHSRLYLPDYPIGAMIALQIEQQVERAGDLGGEFERMSRIGRLSPDLWMEQASGAPVGPEAMLAAAVRALEQVQGAAISQRRLIRTPLMTEMR